MIKVLSTLGVVSAIVFFASPATLKAEESDKSHHCFKRALNVAKEEIPGEKRDEAKRHFKECRHEGGDVRECAKKAVEKAGIDKEKADHVVKEFKHCKDEHEKN